MTILSRRQDRILPPPTLAIEFDDYLGYHALVLDGDSVLWISDSFQDPDAAERQATYWFWRNYSEIQLYLKEQPA